MLTLKLRKQTPFMKFLQILQILKTNEILKIIQEKHPSFTIDLEVFSCKSSTRDKKYKHFSKPFRYLVETLELAFPDYNFKEENSSNFTKMTYQEVINELMYSLMILYKCKSTVSEFVQFISLIIDKTVYLDDCEIFSYKNRNGPFEKYSWYFSFLFYSKNGKRVLMLNLKNIN